MNPIIKRAAWLVGCAILSVSFAQDKQKTTTLAETLGLIQKKVDERKFNIIEYPELLSNVPEYAALEAQSKDVWRDALANLQVIAPSDFSKRVLFESFQGLDSKSYLEFLNQAASLCENGQISKDIFVGVLSPSGRMQAFLVDNYKHPAVRALLERAKRLFPENPQERKSIDSILSGDSKAMLDNYRGALGNSKGEPSLEIKLDGAMPPGITATPMNGSGIATPTATEGIPTTPDTTQTTASFQPRGRPLVWLVGIAMVCLLTILLLARASKSK